MSLSLLTPLNCFSDQCVKQCKANRITLLSTHTIATLSTPIPQPVVNSILYFWNGCGVIISQLTSRDQCGREQKVWAGSPGTCLRRREWSWWSCWSPEQIVFHRTVDRLDIRCFDNKGNSEWNKVKTVFAYLLACFTSSNLWLSKREHDMWHFSIFFFLAQNLIFPKEQFWRLMF